MTDFNVEILRPWLLLIMVPALILGIIPFFKLHKNRRSSTKHIIPFIIHLVLVFLLTTLVSGVRVVETTTAPIDSTVIFVVDVSDSSTEMHDEMNTFMKNIIAESENSEGKVTFGYVPFAGNVFEKDVVKPGFFDTDAENIIEYDENADRSESNIENALKYVKNMFSSGRQNKRVVILSDGRETDGNAWASAKDLVDEGIRLDASYFDIADKNGSKAEVQLISIATSGKVEQDKDVTINVTVKSTISVPKATLVVYDGDYKHEQTITIEKGDNKFTTTYDPKETGKVGLHTVYAEIKTPNDTLEQNNTLASWYTVDDKGSILIVHGDSTQKAQLSSIALENYYVKQIYQPREFPTTMEALLEYDEVVLLNVNFGALPVGSDALIKRYVEENGRGLVVTSGSNTYQYGKYVDTPIADILPVDLRIKEEKETVAAVIVVDLSSSMKEIVSTDEHGKTMSRYEMVLMSTLQAVDALDATKDYIGVIVFDEKAHVAVELTHLPNNVDQVKEKIEKEFDNYYYEHYLDEDGNLTDQIILNTDDKDPAKNQYIQKNNWQFPSTVVGGNGMGTDSAWNNSDKSTGGLIRSFGTNYRWPVQEASSMLSNGRQEQRLDVTQVIFLSDGAPGDAGSGYLGMVDMMAKSGTVTSTIGIGVKNDTNDKAFKELDSIAKKGYGQLVLVNDASLPEKLFEIVQSRQGESYNDLTEEGGVTPERFNTSPVLDGVGNRFDTIYGYYGTTIKQGANMVLFADNLKPIIAEWNVGLGKVSVFMSDFGSAWTSDMFNDEDGIQNTKLIKNILVSAMNEQTDSTGIDIYEKPKRTENDKGEQETIIRVELPVNVRKNEVIKAIAKDANGEIVSEAEFSSTSSKKYRATLSTPDATATYVIEIKLVDVKQNVEMDVLYDQTSTAVTGYYKDEYNIFSKDGKTVLNDLVKIEATDRDLVDAPMSFFEIAKDDIAIYNHDMETPFAIIVLVLFVLAIIFRNFAFQKERKKKEMTDEEQIASMRGSGR